MIDLMLNWTDAFLLMVFAHAIADYPLQGDFLARAKYRDAIASVPWYQAMGAHCAIHGGFVALITGSWLLAAAEFAAHWVTDDLKCRGRITYNVDQAIHIACKAAWALIACCLL